ncbi:MAG: DUF3455 domain-containing protein [Acidobacteria bacterium]|nr:DUF3455 domain-containing protein [Acidobacteriota bacterium]
MTYRLDRQGNKTVRVRRLFAVALVLGCAFCTATNAAAQPIKPPDTPTLITPPVGNSLFLVGRAAGTQGYICLPTSPGASTASWTAKPARPEATLFQSFFRKDFQIITHFLSPDANPNDDAPVPLPFGNATWQSSFDSSKVWAAVLNSNTIPAGSHPSCPNAGSIACLLLQSIGSQQGPTGGKILANTTFIQRLNTNGGSAPDNSDGCASIAQVGNQRLVPYTADYLFYRKSE